MSKNLIHLVSIFSIRSICKIRKTCMLYSQNMHITNVNKRVFMLTISR